MPFHDRIVRLPSGTRVAWQPIRLVAKQWRQQYITTGKGSLPTVRLTHDEAIERMLSGFRWSWTDKPYYQSICDFRINWQS